MFSDILRILVLSHHIQTSHNLYYVKLRGGDFLWLIEDVVVLVALVGFVVVVVVEFVV